jgi:hypothetical protein
VLKDRIYIVQYERLVQDPQATLSAVRDFLELRELFPDAKPQSGSLDKWRDYLTEEDVDRIHGALKSLAETELTSKALLL